MENIEVTIREIHMVCYVSYSMGLITVLVLYAAARIWHHWRELRRWRKEIIVNRPTPRGI